MIVFALAVVAVVRDRERHKGEQRTNKKPHLMPEFAAFLSSLSVADIKAPAELVIIDSNETFVSGKCVCICVVAARALLRVFFFAVVLLW